MTEPQIEFKFDQLLQAIEDDDRQAEEELISEICSWTSKDISELTKLSEETINELNQRTDELRNSIKSKKEEAKTSNIRNHEDQLVQEWSDYDQYLKILESENQTLLTEKQDLEKKCLHLDEKIRKRKKELNDRENAIKNNELLEDSLTNEYFDYKMAYMDWIKQRTSIDFRHRYIRSLANRLSNTNVFLLTFQITENLSKEIASIAINGFKLSGSILQDAGNKTHFGLGRTRQQQQPSNERDAPSGGTTLTRNLSNLPTISESKIDWSEINCAWGQLALLVNGLIQKFSVSKPENTVIAMGPWSYIEKQVEGTEKEKLPLYHNTNNWMNLIKGNDQKYSEACIAMVDYFEFLCKEAIHIYYVKLEFQNRNRFNNHGLPVNSSDNQNQGNSGINNFLSAGSDQKYLYSKWSTIKKNYSEGKYNEAGYLLLKNVAIILSSDKLN